LVTAALVFALPFVVQAAGLGKLTVTSPLGQPLNAEIEVVALQPGEEDSLTARLASPEAFAQAGIEISPVLNSVRFSVERRGGRTVLRITSAQPVNEPFLELLVELSWQSGRLVREYTFLLDPPEYKSRVAITPTPAPAAPVEQPAAPKPAPEAAAPTEPKPAPQVEATPAEPAPAPATAAPATPPSMETPPAPLAAPSAAPTPPAAEMPQEPKIHEVRKGDTLGQIAKQNLPPGVTLNQMLIALYRANEAAFIRKNINLVRAGRILNIPDASVIGTVDPAEADRVVKEHYAQFNEYRSRLAAAPATTAAAPSDRASAGVIAPKPAAPSPAAPQEQLRLSKAEPTKPAAPGARAAREDDAAARQRTLQESQSRVGDLERNVADLQKLLELKNQQLAELEKRATAKPAPAAPTPEKPAAKAAEAPKPPAVVAEPPKPAAAEPAKPAAPAVKAEPPKPVAEAQKPPAAEPAKPAPTPEPKKAEAPKPPADAKKAAPPPPPAAGVVDEILDNPLYLGLLGGVLLLLIAYAYIAWRRKKTAQAKFQDSVLGAAAANSGAAPAVAGEATPPPAAPGGAPAAAPASGAKAGATPGAEEVDPIAEADVYMAYGRDAQAEEILKEVLQKDSNRVAVHAKLLEIYAGRKDAKTFEQTALKLKGLTSGAGPEWDKAAALGRSIDAGNGLYGAGGAAAPAPAAAAPAAPAAAPTLDFDLGGAGQQQSAPDISLDEAPKEASASPALDFDLGNQTQQLQMKAEPDADKTVVLKREAASGAIDFNLDLGGAKPAEASVPAAAAPKDESSGLDFDLNLDTGGDKKADASAPAPSMDLSAISLDLGMPGEASAAPAAAGGSDPKWQEVATKLDLAKAYEEMGDKDGARELLNEVMKDGDAAQKGTAQQLLAKLG
jgi:pilus assembly protein FimV